MESDTLYVKLPRYINHSIPYVMHHYGFMNNIINNIEY